MWKVYALLDPETLALMYIGCTSQALKTRLFQHVSDAANKGQVLRPLHIWLRAQVSRPPITLLEECATRAAVRLAEQQWIEKHQPPLNIQWSDQAHEHFAEVNKVKSEKTKGRPKSEEWKEKIRQGHLRGGSNRGKVRSPELVAQIKATLEARKAAGLPVGRPRATEDNPKTLQWRAWLERKRLKESQQE